MMKKEYISLNKNKWANDAETLQMSKLSRIDRIIYMESCYDELLEAIKLDQKSISANNKLQKCYEALTAYYENGLWLQDYECDERGELPKKLKRGVLSQDALYDLLSEIDYKYLFSQK